MANNNGFDPENIEENLISSDGEINSGNLDNEPALEEPLQYIEEDIYLEEVPAEPQGLVIDPDAIEVIDSFVQPMAFGDFILMSTQGVGDPDDGIGGGGPLGTPPGTYNKDIIITPGRLNTNGTNADRYSQIDVKFSADDAYLGVVRSSEKKASIYNFAEAYTISATSYDFPILAIGGSWNAGAGNSTFAPSTTWGGSTGLSLIQIDSQAGKGAGLVLRPAISQIEAALYNNIGLYTSSSATEIVLTSYSNLTIAPGATPTSVRSLTVNTGNITLTGNSGGGRTLTLTSNLTVNNQTASDTLTLSLQSATSTQQYFVGGGTAQYQLSTGTATFAAGDLYHAAGSAFAGMTRLSIPATYGGVLYAGNGAPAYTAAGPSGVPLIGQGNNAAPIFSAITITPVSSPRPIPVHCGLLATACAKRLNLPRLSK